MKTIIDRRISYVFLLLENLRLLVALFLVQSLEKELRKEARED